MEFLKSLAEQADFDFGHTDASKLRPFNNEFSDKGRADTKVRPNDPRFGDNPMEDVSEDAELTPDSSQIEVLHQMLTRAGISDQQIRGGVTLTDAGKAKVAGQLGIGPDDVDAYINSLVQDLRDKDADDEEQELSEQYRRFVEAGRSDHPF